MVCLLWLISEYMHMYSYQKQLQKKYLCLSISFIMYMPYSNFPYQLYIIISYSNDLRLRMSIILTISFVVFYIRRNKSIKLTLLYLGFKCWMILRNSARVFWMMPSHQQTILGILESPKKTSAIGQHRLSPLTLKWCERMSYNKKPSKSGF